MIRQIMRISVIELKVLNIMLPFQTLVLLKEHLDLNYTMKESWSLLSLDDGS